MAFKQKSHKLQCLQSLKVLSEKYLVSYSEPLACDSNVKNPEGRVRSKASGKAFGQKSIHSELRHTFEKFEKNT